MSSPLNDDTEAQVGAVATSHEEATVVPAAVRRPVASGKRAKVHQLVLLRDLKASLDVLYTVQIATAYYLDNSFIVLSLRLVSQSLLARAETQSMVDQVHTYFAILFVPGILCSLVHLILALATPGEATRGYLHGSLLLDFVGQSGSVSRMQLILHDFLLFALQLVYLDVCRKRREVSRSLKGRRSLAQSVHTNTLQTQPPTIQDLDREERASEQQDHEETYEGSLMPADSTASLLESLYSGQSDLGTFWMLQIVKDKQYMHIQGLQESTATLSSVIESDIRRRGYALSIPFRS